MSTLIDLDVRYEALARLACKTHSRSSLGWALWRLRQRWARERTRLLLAQPLTLGGMARHLIPLPCAPTLADPDPHALMRLADDGAPQRCCTPLFPCDCPDCE
jgi:hypothetical protein